jgi:hypothetical protein
VRFHQVFAVVDSEYRLLWVGGEWDEFALQNAAHHALADHVLSTSLMAHVAGDETRRLLAQMINSVLDAKRPLRLGYRCDGPGMARAYQLTIQPMKDDRVLMVHDLKDAWHFAPPLNSWRYDPNARDCKCSFCGSVRFSQATEWTSCDDVGERHPSLVFYEVCNNCRQTISEAIERVPEGQDVVVSAVHDEFLEAGHAKDQRD